MGAEARGCLETLPLVGPPEVSLDLKPAPLSDVRNVMGKSVEPG
jgi:hypothetical protein